MEKTGAKSFIIIEDLENFGMANNDSDLNLSIVHFMNDMFPGRMDAVFVVNIPSIFWYLWKLMSPFLGPRTKQKIHVLSREEQKQELLHVFEEDQLPDSVGGPFKLPAAEKDMSKS